MSISSMLVLSLFMSEMLPDLRKNKHTTRHEIPGGMCVCVCVSGLGEWVSSHSFGTLKIGYPNCAICFVIFTLNNDIQ